MIEDRIVGRLEVWGGKTAVAVEREFVAPCGCYAVVGLRLDRNPEEVVIGFYSCDDHKAEIFELERSYARDAYNRWEREIDSPDGERDLYEVLQERLAKAIGDAPA
jgi:hypothetical protein